MSLVEVEKLYEKKGGYHKKPKFSWAQSYKVPDAKVGSAIQYSGYGVYGSFQSKSN